MNHFAIVAATAAAFFVTATAAQTRSITGGVRAFAAVEKPTTNDAYEPGQAELRQLADSASQAVAAAQYDEAAELFGLVLAAGNFAQLSPQRRHFVLTSAAEVASLRADFASARRLYERASQHELAGSDDWMGRLNAAWFLGDLDDAVASLEHIAIHWPAELDFVSEWAMDALLAHARSRNNSTELKLLQVLFDQSWQTDLGREPTHLWLRLFELLAESNQTETALAVSSRLRDPLAVVSILSDRRFMTIVDSAPDWFSVAEAIDASIIEARLAVESNPHLLAPAVALAEALLHGNREREALLVIETHMARSALKSVIGESLEDAVSETVRALTTKALALIALDRFDEAATVLRLAGEQALPKHRLNDLLDVAQLQACLGLPDAALQTLERIAAPADGARAGFVRFLTARAGRDTAAENQALDALIANAQDAPAQAQRALLLAGRLDAAAELLIARLNDSRHRVGALLELQRMHEQTWPETSLDWRTRATRLIAREDVRESLAASGAIVSNYEIYRWN